MVRNGMVTCLVAADRLLGEEQNSYEESAQGLHRAQCWYSEAVLRIANLKHLNWYSQARNLNASRIPDPNLIKIHTRASQSPTGAPIK